GRFAASRRPGRARAARPALWPRSARPRPPYCRHWPDRPGPACRSRPSGRGAGGHDRHRSDRAGHRLPGAQGRCRGPGGRAGQAVPDLAGVGASAQVDYLIESILPSKAIKENYHALIVTTKDGRYFTGLKVRETRTELILRTADDQETAIPRKQIDEVATGGS